MPEPLRIPMYSKRKKLLGYWYLRQRGDTYLVTYTYPGQRHKRYVSDDPEFAVSMLYDAYIGYLGRRFLDLENQLAELPKTEYRRAGFRPGWLKKLRRKLQADRSQMIEGGRRELVSKLRELQSRGWPTPPTPPLPWDKVDCEKAASYAFVRIRDRSDVRDRESADKFDMPRTGNELRDRQGSPPIKRYSSTGTWVSNPTGIGPSFVETFFRRPRGSGDSPSVGAGSWLPCTKVRYLARKGEADSQTGWCADRERVTASETAPEDGGQERSEEEGRGSS